MPGVGPDGVTQIDGPEVRPVKGASLLLVLILITLSCPEKSRAVAQAFQPVRLPGRAGTPAPTFPFHALRVGHTAHEELFRKGGAGGGGTYRLPAGRGAAGLRHPAGR